MTLSKVERTMIGSEVGTEATYSWAGRAEITWTVGTVRLMTSCEVEVGMMSAGEIRRMNSSRAKL